MNIDALASAGIQFIVLLCALALHEFAHAWVADRRGDPLPRQQGRVTLDPFAHLDPIGSFLIPGAMIFLPVLLGGGMPVALIGWGKPVQVSLPNAKTRMWDDILTTLAGPGMNLLLALGVTLLGGVLLGLAAPGSLEVVFSRLIFPALFINLVLVVFNLIPLPPLDGSRVMRYVVGMREETFSLLARNSWWVLLLAINIPEFRQVMGTVVLHCAAPFLWLMERIAVLLA